MNDRPRALHLKACRFGVTVLKVFWWTTLVAVIALAAALAAVIAGPWPIGPWLGCTAVVAVVETIVFWTGIVTVYLSSVQLGLKWRVIGVLCGWIPVANLIALRRIIRIVEREVIFETAKEQLNASRAQQRVCATRYPILLVHGVFFRDSNLLNYWGRVPAELERNGATVLYGNHQSAASVPDSARELAERIRGIVAETGCGKVNVIAHSKGGLDLRYAIARYGIGPLVASLTTINTPHRGCGFADYLLGHIPAAAQQRVARPITPRRGGWATLPRISWPRCMT